MSWLSKDSSAAARESLKFRKLEKLNKLKHILMKKYFSRSDQEVNWDAMSWWDGRTSYNSMGLRRARDASFPWKVLGPSVLGFLWRWLQRARGRRSCLELRPFLLRWWHQRDPCDGRVELTDPRWSSQQALLWFPKKQMRHQLLLMNHKCLLRNLQHYIASNSRRPSLQPHHRFHQSWWFPLSGDP